MGTSATAAGEIINIGPDEGKVSILDLAEVIADLLGFDHLDPIFVPPRPLEVKVALCSSDKARRLLGYETKTSLAEGLSSMIDWIDRHGPVEFSYGLDIEILTAATPSTWVEKLI
jgi:UDP-glucose 4-epimerase